MTYDMYSASVIRYNLSDWPNESRHSATRGQYIGDYKDIFVYGKFG